MKYNLIEQITRALWDYNKRNNQSIKLHKSAEIAIDKILDNYFPELDGLRFISFGDIVDEKTDSKDITPQIITINLISYYLPPLVLKLETIVGEKTITTVELSSYHKFYLRFTCDDAYSPIDNVTCNYIYMNDIILINYNTETVDSNSLNPQCKAYGTINIYTNTAERKIELQDMKPIELVPDVEVNFKSHSDNYTRGICLCNWRKKANTLADNHHETFDDYMRRKGK